LELENFSFPAVFPTANSTEIEVKAALQSMPLRAITEWVEDSNGHQFFASQHQNYAPDQVLSSSQSFGMIGRYILPVTIS